MDRIDSQILLRLQENARISNVELAAAVGLSPSACLRRVNLLEQSGVIDSYNASLNAAKLGHEVLVLMQITLEGQSAEMLAEFEAAAAKIPQVLACFLIAGETTISCGLRRAMSEISEGYTPKSSRRCHMCCAWKAAS